MVPGTVTVTDPPWSTIIACEFNVRLGAVIVRVPAGITVIVWFAPTTRSHVPKSTDPGVTVTLWFTTHWLFVQVQRLDGGIVGRVVVVEEVVVAVVVVCAATGTPAASNATTRKA
jgi:hypothetical protein